jgi:acyl dehydratase
LQLAADSRDPILHGMCTHGITSRLLINAVCGGDPARVRSMSGRSTKPVMPGITLTTHIWVDGGAALFQARDADGGEFFTVAYSSLRRLGDAD